MLEKKIADYHLFYTLTLSKLTFKFYYIKKKNWLCPLQHYDISRNWEYKGFKQNNSF